MVRKKKIHVTPQNTHKTEVTIVGGRVKNSWGELHLREKKKSTVNQKNSSIKGVEESFPESHR
jgi:hypothetical protein